KYTVLMGGDKTTLMLTPAADAGDPGTQRPPSVVTLELVRSNKLVSPEGNDLLPGKSNYYIGKKSTDWITGIPQYGRVTLKSIYAGIDLVYYGHDGQLEYDFVLSPGADPKLLSYSTLIGANNSTQVQGVAVDSSGNVYITGTTSATNYPTVKAFQSKNDA